MADFYAHNPKEEPMPQHACHHSFVNRDGVCSNCGSVFTSFYHGEIEGSSGCAEQGIRHDMEHIAVPDEVKERANQIYFRLRTPTHRGRRRKLLVFFCIFHAYSELNIAKDPRHIARLVGVGAQEVTKAISQFSTIDTGYAAEVKTVSPLEMIPEFCHRLNSDIDVASVQELAKEILDRSQSLLELYPQKVAAGIIQYWMHIHGVTFNKQEFSQLMSLSPATINSMEREIASIHNA